MFKPEIRCDDVLQTSRLTGHQCVCKGKRKTSLFKLFLKADKVLEKYNYPCTLTLLSEGIDTLPEWVAHIKKNQHRYKIELHGKTHSEYNIFSEKELYEDLKEAKEKIEKTFNIKVTAFYPPWGKLGKQSFQKRVYKKLGLIVKEEPTSQDVRTWLKGYRATGKSLFPQTSFHYWYKVQVKYLEEILKEIC